jgi:hypothetical protein
VNDTSSTAAHGASLFVDIGLWLGWLAIGRLPTLRTKNKPYIVSEAKLGGQHAFQDDQVSFIPTAMRKLA